MNRRRIRLLLAAALHGVACLPAAADDTHCGARSLAYVMNGDREVGIEEQRELILELDREKVDGLLPFPALATAARRRGLSADFVPVSDSLRSALRGRLIVHIHAAHYAVFAGVDELDRIVLWMGPRGCQSFSRDEFSVVASSPALLVEGPGIVQPQWSRVVLYLCSGLLCFVLLARRARNSAALTSSAALPTL